LGGPKSLRLPIFLFRALSTCSSLTFLVTVESLSVYVVS
jgi:hypothetical protein